MSSQEGTALNDGTTVPLRWVVGIVLALVTGFGTVIGAYTWLDTRFDATINRIGGVENKLDQIQQDRWARSEMVVWVSDFKQLNPQLNVPPVPRQGAPR